MNGFSINKILFHLINNELFLKKIIKKDSDINKNISSEFNTQLNNKHNANFIENNVIKIPLINNLKPFSNVERTVFIKNLLGLPPTLGEALQHCQNINKPINGGTLGIMNINPEMLSSNKILSDLFEEINPNILANQSIMSSIAVPAKVDAITLMFSGMISMPDISKLILENSKQALSSLILTMTNAAKQGIDVRAIQETLSVLNVCINMAESDNTSQNLKSLMLLYLPWLPLSENANFDLEITMQDDDNDLNNSKLIVLIQTKNYGNLKGVFTLSTSNSIDIYIICNDSFPKKNLLEKLLGESKTYAMNTNIDIENFPQIINENEVQETKVNLSATNELNPYLLLMAHSFIRYTIEIDMMSLTNLVADSQS